MGYTSIYAITFVALVGALLGVSKAQPSGSCLSTLTTLSPCLGYITGNSTTPSQTCCSQLDSVIKSSPQCICSAVNSPIRNIGLNINRTQALQLPNACNIQAPRLSQCNVATGPTTPLGALSPVESPADKNPGVALTPTSSPGARSGVVVGARGGSKTIPSTGAGSSSGSVDRVPPHLFMYAIFVVWTYSLLNQF
ncbi:non-specific lipid transfer protein GPI-anchored 15 [Brassica napus]|uniref:non-specific lipid transfer protein GPI-anchored 15 n=1 Tax=Brassica napus TaxID=3708 RepID=UPI0006AB422C|nr:non-specific lipid transfer protein GPI-anchored 15 [Brassica napus]